MRERTIEECAALCEDMVGDSDPYSGDDYAMAIRDLSTAPTVGESDVQEHARLVEQVRVLREALGACVENHQMLLNRIDGSFHMTGQTAVALLQNSTDNARSALAATATPVSAQPLSDFGTSQPMGEAINAGRTSSRGNP